MKVITIIEIMAIVLFISGVAFFLLTYNISAGQCIADPLQYGLDRFASTHNTNFSCSCWGELGQGFIVEAGP